MLSQDSLREWVSTRNIELAIELNADVDWMGYLMIIRFICSMMEWALGQTLNMHRIPPYQLPSMIGVYLWNANALMGFIH